MLIATPNVVLVRNDIHPALIDLLAQAIVETSGKPGIFQQAGEFPTLIDPEYPLAPSARDFYKNGPSFLNRYLPFWMTSYAQRILAVLVAVVAIVLPVFTYAPKLYLWFVRDQISKLYRRLRMVDKALLTELTAANVQSLRTDLENIDRAASVVPMRNSDLFFDLRTHIDRTRAHLDARLLKPRSHAPVVLCLKAISGCWKMIPPPKKRRKPRLLPPLRPPPASDCPPLDAALRNLPDANHARAPSWLCVTRLESWVTCCRAPLSCSSPGARPV
jgi:hypothetical protein